MVFICNLESGDLSYFIQIIHHSPIDVLAIKDCDDLMDISIIAEKLRKLHLLWHPYNKSSSVGSLKILAPNLENFRWGGHVLDYHCIEDFWSKLNLITALRLSDQLYESLTKYYLKGIPIEQRDCCFIIYSPVATLPYFIFNHILNWVFLQTRKNHFNLHLHLLA